ncbi:MULTISPECIES: hypothetical protein [unclassified Variovorax]|uniref:hypothetical protein n=1 Tax=unclassified Variovorax TaxID=663243 RepID=UPI002575C9F4|nr:MULTISPECIES: hypothetical protein [unclassified Variovorax]MDM0088823.1 hypothetical protein [Variovorax sp. J22G40]MDM0146896.1 hypothetical protein [Variovorax sp. J2P1-31]
MLSDDELHDITHLRQLAAQARFLVRRLGPAAGAERDRGHQHDAVCSVGQQQARRVLALHWPQVDNEVIRLQRAKQRSKKTKLELVGMSEALRVVLDRMRAMPTYSHIGPVFAAPRTGRLHRERVQDDVGPADGQGAGRKGHRDTVHVPRAARALHHLLQLQFGELPGLHADRKTTEGVYEQSREVRREAL